MNKSSRFSIGKKISLFVGLMVFLAALTVAILAYFINVNSIDEYFKELSLNMARNFAAIVDADYLQELRIVVESEEYQAIRDKAEEDDDEQPVIDYLKEHGLWDQYLETRDLLMSFLKNVDNIKYLYILACGDKNAEYDLILIDDEDNPVYVTGYCEERGEAFEGFDASVESVPTISYGDWGWLCSSYVPVYTDDGKLACSIGCDVSMDTIMHERHINLLYVCLVAIAVMVLIVFAFMFIIRRIIINPLAQITGEMKKFSPSEDHDHERSGVINLDIRNKDEIKDIYDEIRSMQIRILDYLDDINIIQEEKKKVEDDIIKKEKEIGMLSEDAYRDSLTSVGSKTAYAKKIEEINNAIRSNDNEEFAIVMVDINFLKDINDKYGHALGDSYLKGCCKTVCEIYKHSPIYRIGGDEFVVILTGEDYHDRYIKLKETRDTFKESYENDKLDPWLRYSAASGMAEYASDDNTFELVFKRADKQMYENKSEFKRSQGMNPHQRMR